jgi:hypothetical protein
MSIRGMCLLGLAALLLSVRVSQAKEPKYNKNTEVTVEVKFASLDERVIEQLKQEGLLEKESKEKGVLSLDNAQMQRFMEIAQGEIHTNVMQAPRMTMLNGQTMMFNSGDEQHFVTGLEIVSHDGQIEYLAKRETVPLGWRVTLRSVVSKDRRFVRVHLDANANNLDSTEVPQFRITTPDPNGKGGAVTHYIDRPKINKIAVNRKMVIPDGKTAVLATDCKQQIEARNEYGTPILSNLPLIGPRLFRTVGYSRQTLLLVVLVTPRILVPEEKAETQSDEAAGIQSGFYHEHHYDNRTSIFDKYRENDPHCPKGPDEARVLRALPPLRRLPGIYEEARDNIQIVTERIVDKVDPPRLFPLVGTARLHHCNWKCTVYYTETITGGYPTPFRCSHPRVQVVHIDADHLHRVAIETPPAK